MASEHTQQHQSAEVLRRLSPSEQGRLCLVNDEFRNFTISRHDSDIDLSQMTAALGERFVVEWWGPSRLSTQTIEQYVQTVKQWWRVFMGGLPADIDRAVTEGLAIVRNNRRGLVSLSLGHSSHPPRLETAASVRGLPSI